MERARPHAGPGEEDRVYPPPRFIIPLQDSIQFEGGKVHFEARIEPVGDPSMVVEWYLNGKLMAASKFFNFLIYYFVLGKLPERKLNKILVVLLHSSS